MKKNFTFLIVLIVWVIVIFAIYKWWSGSSSTSTKPQDTTSQTQNSNAANASAQTKPAEAVVPDYLKELGLTKPVDVDAVPQPFNYDKAITGNIPALPLSEEAKTGLLVNLNTREVLWAKDAKTPVQIASMTKMMSALLFMKGMQSDSKISLDTEIPVTREASHIGGSRVWLDPREKFGLRILLESVMVHSANDSTYLLAQYFAGGDADTFVGMMNDEAKKLGLTSTFHNCEGLPEKNPKYDNRGSAQDMAFLAEKLLEFPIIPELAKHPTMVFRPNTEKALNLVNTSLLIRYGFPGVNGMKTGFTAGAGFCITATCDRDGKVFVVVLTGFKTAKARDAFARQLFTWAYSGSMPVVKKENGSKKPSKKKAESRKKST